MNEYFRQFAHKVSAVVGSAGTFIGAVIIILIWGVSGPLFDFSDTWQLIINTSTTIVTFLMVFLIQNTQNRDAKAIHLKLDELLRGLKGVRTDLVDLEELSDEELEKLQEEFRRIRERAHKSAEVAEEGEQAAAAKRNSNSSPKRKSKKSTTSGKEAQKAHAKSAVHKNGAQ